MEATIAYIRYMTKRGRRYAYLQRSYRVPGRRTPKTDTKYLGRDDGFARSMATLERENKALDEWQRKTFGETGAERQAREQQERQFSQEKFLQDTVVESDTGHNQSNAEVKAE